MRTRSTLLDSDWAEQPSNYSGFRMFPREPSVCRGWNAVRVPPRARVFLVQGLAGLSWGICVEEGDLAAVAECVGDQWWRGLRRGARRSLLDSLPINSGRIAPPIRTQRFSSVRLQAHAERQIRLFVAPALRAESGVGSPSPVQSRRYGLPAGCHAGDRVDAGRARPAPGSPPPVLWAVESPRCSTSWITSESHQLQPYQL